MDGGLATQITTHSTNSAITDSAAAAIALATGYKTNNYRLSVSPKGEIFPTILERAREHGLVIGLVATTAITHATPAAFAAHRFNPSDEVGVALDYLESEGDLLFSGGRGEFLPSEKGGKRVDGRDAI